MASSEINPDPSKSDMTSNLEKARNLAEEARRRAANTAQTSTDHIEDGTKTVADNTRKGAEEAKRRIGVTADELIEGEQVTTRRIGEGISGLGDGIRRRVGETPRDIRDGSRRRIGDTSDNLIVEAQEAGNDALPQNSDGSRGINNNLANDEDIATSDTAKSRGASQSTESFLMGDPPASEPLPPPKKGLGAGQKVPLAIIGALALLCALASIITIFLANFSSGRSVSTRLPSSTSTSLTNTASITGSVGSVITATRSITGVANSVTTTIRSVSGTVTGTGGSAATSVAAAVTTPSPTPQPSLIQRLISFLGLGPRTPPAPPSATAVAGGVAKPNTSPLATPQAAASNTGAASAIIGTVRAPTSTIGATGAITGSTSVTSTKPVTIGTAVGASTSSTSTVTSTTSSGGTGTVTGTTGTTTDSSGATTDSSGAKTGSTGTTGSTEGTKEIPKTGAAANDSLRVCSGANYGGGECANDATVLPRGINRLYASWSPSLVAGRNFDVVWYGMERGRMIIIRSYDCNWNAAKGAHTCTGDAYSSVSSSSAYIQANPAKWGNTVPVNQYRVALQINDQILIQQNFSVR
ncbi:MAG: hypothetical protein KGS46_14620 [Chloroflexi bacterium]|nr:hypothetical protein [Chloroflexota bacterium]